jgi:hypothetical protein
MFSTTQIAIFSWGKIGIVCSEKEKEKGGWFREE